MGARILHQNFKFAKKRSDHYAKIKRDKSAICSERIEKVKIKYF